MTVDVSNGIEDMAGGRGVDGNPVSTICLLFATLGLDLFIDLDG